MENKKIWLYLDDVRTPNDETWIVVRSYEEFVNAVNMYGLDFIERISFDHDLGDGAMKEYWDNVQPNYKLDYNNITEKTGYDCVKWLVNHSIETMIPIPITYVHSANPIGAANMMGYLNNYYKNYSQKKSCQMYVWPHTYISIVEDK